MRNMKTKMKTRGVMDKESERERDHVSSHYNMSTTPHLVWPDLVALTKEEQKERMKERERAKEDRQRQRERETAPQTIDIGTK